MALLCRYVKLNDKSGTSVFTFIVTKSLTRDLHREITSKEFTFGCQKWSIAFTRTDKLLGVYLIWKNPSRGVKVFLDFNFTLLNCEHFSYNESFIGKQVKFTTEVPAQGIKRFISYADMCNGNFSDVNGEFQMELVMSNICTVFDYELPMRPECLAEVSSSSFQRIRRFETESFLYGGFKWNIVLHIHMDHKIDIKLRRNTGLEHQCHVKYYLLIGEGNKMVDSGLIDDISDSKGKGYIWCLKTGLAELLIKNTLHVQLEMLIANPISEVPIPLSALNTDSRTEFLDMESHTWTLEPNTKGDLLRLQLIYKDIRSVPRNHLRHVHWYAYVLKRYPNSSRLHAVRTKHLSYSKYYPQDDVDEGVIMETDIVSAEFMKNESLYLDDRKHFKVHIEWLENLLLFQAFYHNYDDICRIHNQQMRREIAALLTENQSLERQISMYQHSLNGIRRKHFPPMKKSEDFSEHYSRCEKCPASNIKYSHCYDSQGDSYRQYHGGENGNWSSDTEYA